MKKLSMELFLFAENTSAYIPKDYNHILEIIEIQTGSYLDEDDIIRLKDAYFRN